MGCILKVVAIIQARMGSTRFPNKVLKKLGQFSLIEFLLKRLSLANEIDQIVLATSHDERNKPLIEHVGHLGFECFAGSEDDVLDRYCQVAKKMRADIVIRITGDCPFVDPELVDDFIKVFKNNNVDYVSNTLSPSYPDGLDIEVFSSNALNTACEKGVSSFQREHVTPYIKESKEFSKINVTCEEDLSGKRWTVDEQEDFEVAQNVVSHFFPAWNFGWKSILELERSSPELFAANTKFSSESYADYYKRRWYGCDK